MTFAEIIAKKRNGESLSREEIALFVRGAADGTLPPEQLAALLMAICIRGMTTEETGFLTDEMLHSGETWRLADAVPEAVDKHSTGGIGDTVSLIFAPLVASVGTPVAMMAGRGLGHSQGTLDKLEAIPGFRVDRDRDGMLELLERCGAAIVAQTDDVAPADRTLYALRDVTATVPSLPRCRRRSSSRLRRRRGMHASCRPEPCIRRWRPSRLFPGPPRRRFRIRNRCKLRDSP